MAPSKHIGSSSLQSLEGLTDTTSTVASSSAWHNEAARYLGVAAVPFEGSEDVEDTCQRIVERAY
jgi:hypothetical protein